MIPLHTLLKFFTVFSLLITATLSFAQEAQPTAPADDIRPIRGSVTIPEPEVSSLPQTAAQSLAAIIVIAAIIGLIFWLKRRAKTRRIPNLQQKAISALTKTKSILSEDRSRDYSISVSDIVRDFIESRFQLPITQRTTQEFIRELAANNEIHLGPYRQTLDHFLNQCDFGKFSGDTLTSLEMEKLHAAALDVVQCEPTANEATKKP